MGNDTITANGSGAARRSLGRILYDLRLQAGVKPTDLARNRIVSRDKLWRIEHGKSPVRSGDVAALCWAYKVDAETTDRLTAFSVRTLEQTIYEKYRDVMPSWFGMYVELESFASVVSSYQPELVPGLLQTPEYAQAVFEAYQPSLSPAVIEQRVATRGERTRNLLDREEPPLVKAVISEAALARQVGGSHVMGKQITHLRAINADESSRRSRSRRLRWRTTTDEHRPEPVDQG